MGHLPHLPYLSESLQKEPKPSRSRRLLPPCREGKHEATEVVLLHFEKHLLIEGIHLLLRGDPHPDDKRLEQFAHDSGILAKTLILFCPSTAVDHVSHQLNTDTTR